MESIKKEYLPILDEKFNVIGKDVRSAFHTKKEKLLHPVVHLHLINSENNIFLQLRPEYKLIQPGKWDTAVGGHVRFGESIKLALKRETKEEIGLEINNQEAVYTYIWETELEKEWVNIFVLHTNILPIIDLNELSDGKFWTKTEIRENLETGIFTPNFIHEFQLLSSQNIL